VIDGLRLLSRSSNAHAVIVLGDVIALTASERELPREDVERVVQHFLDAQGRVTELFVQKALLQHVAGLADQLPPDRGDAAVRKATQPLLDLLSRTADQNALETLASALDQVANRIHPKDGFTAAQLLLDALPQVSESSAPRILYRALHRVAGRCTTQNLIDLLKQPTCTGAGRRTVLRELSRRLAPPSPEAPVVLAAGGALAASPLNLIAAAAVVEHSYPGDRQPFADHWQAAAWLRKHRPDLNLDSPPRRLER
jgi:hypothetical protein